MSNACKIDITYDGVTETIYAEKITESFYRCLESCAFIDFINYGCEIEIEEIDGALKFFSLYKKAPYETFRIVCSREFLESDEFKKTKSRIIEIGGQWEILMGGFLICSLPEGKTDEIHEIRNSLGLINE